MSVSLLAQTGGVLFMVIGLVLTAWAISTELVTRRTVTATFVIGVTLLIAGSIVTFGLGGH